MFTSASIVGLGLTEPILRVDRHINSNTSKGVNVTIRKHLEMYIFYLVKNGNRSNA